MIFSTALCNMNHRGEGQYQTVLLTRESADSGLELDRLENGGGLCSAKAEEEEDLNDDEEEEEVEDDDAEDDRRTEEETTATTSRRMMMTETKNRKVGNFPQKGREKGRERNGRERNGFTPEKKRNERLILI
jgi:hypothetical protein